MPTLLLFRHAKSSWSDASLRDKDRPLNERGRKAAPAMAREIARNRWIPDQVLCSSARRTRETLGLCLGAWPSECQINLLDAIYGGDAQDYLNLIRTFGSGERLMLIGHNPAIEDLALELASGTSGQHADAMAVKYPTAAVAQFSVTGAWSDLSPATAELGQFLTPAMIAA